MKLEKCKTSKNNTIKKQQIAREKGKHLHSNEESQMKLEQKREEEDKRKM